MMRTSLTFLLVVLAVRPALGQERSQGGPVKNLSQSPVVDGLPIGEATVRLRKKMTELKTLQAEIEQLRRAAGVEPQQIMIQVQIMKVSRTKLEELGYDLSEGGIAALLVRDGKLSPAAEIGTAAATSETGKQHPISTAILEPGDRCKALIQKWKTEGIIKAVVAEPTIVTVSGRPVFWHVGGEFPILVPSPGGGVASQMHKYGVQLDAVPLLLDDGRVRLQLRPHASEIDESKSITVNGITIPGLRTREIDTGVELTPGQTFAVSGARQVARRKGERGWSLRREEIVEQVEMLVLAKVELVDAMSPLGEQKIAGDRDETPR